MSVCINACESVTEILYVGFGGAVSRMEKLRSPPSPAEHPELSNTLSFKPGVDQNVDFCASRSARNSTISDLFSLGSFNLIFSRCFLERVKTFTFDLMTLGFA